MSLKDKENHFDIIIVGGGASGLMAAALMAGSNKSVLVLEKMRQVGLKLRITGKGRCNLTNTFEKENFLSHCTNGKTHLRTAFSFFSHTPSQIYFFLRSVAILIACSSKPVI